MQAAGGEADERPAAARNEDQDQGGAATEAGGVEERERERERGEARPGEADNRW